MSKATNEAVNPAILKAQRKKRNILIALASVTLITWSKSLFGGDGRPPRTAPPTTTSGPVAYVANPSGTSQSTSQRGSVTGYEQAMERMRVWPEALAREVIAGPIAALTPFSSQSDVTDVGSQPIEMEAAPAWTSPLPEANTTFGLHLSSTAIFGSDRWARISGELYREGDGIEVQVAGFDVRYEVVSIRPREVDIRDGERLVTLKINRRQD